VNQSQSQPENMEAERFYSGAVHRILRTLVILAAVLSGPVAWRYGWAAASGFVAGAGVSWLNFHWLARSVDRLGERIVDESSRESGKAVIAGIVLRYLLVGITSYAIFKSSAQAFQGFLFGLCLPVLAMMGEGAHEAYIALRRGY
jgi:hypothetical protein